MKKIRMKPVVSMESAFDRFVLTKRAKGIKDKTAATYRQHLSAVSHHLNIQKEIEKLTKEDLNQMIVSMRASGLSPNSIRSYVITLRAFFSWCRDEGIPTPSLDSYKGEETIKETYTDDELRLLLKRPNVKKCSFAEYRSWVIVNFLVNAGSRAATIRNIQIRDLDLANKVIYARHTKNSRHLVIPLCGELCAILRDYLNIRGGDTSDYLFCNECGEQLTENALRCSIADYNRRRGVQKTSIHLFRHTFARKYLIDCGGDAFTLQRLLGHSTLDMTRHYCSIFDADIAKNYDELSPLARMKPAERIKMRH